jgi:acetyl esterase/lipase
LWLTGKSPHFGYNHQGFGYPDYFVSHDFCEVNNQNAEVMINTLKENKNTSYKLDGEISAVFAEMAKQKSVMPIPERGDWKTLRNNGNTGWKKWANSAPNYPDVKRRTFFTKTPGGASIELRWYSKEGSKPGSAVVYAHGGGMILSSLDLYDFVVAEYVSRSGVPFLAVDYRLAPESQGTMLTEDVFTGLSWLIAHASELEVDINRIVIMGDSGGGAPAAGAAIIARDHRIPLARQILIYPMLDDVNLTPDVALLPFLTWTYDDNFTAWSAVLGDQLGSEKVSPLIAPARLKDFSGLAPTYIEVGELDIFRDEDIAYAQQLAKADVPVELHVHPGAPHGYDRIAPDSKLTKRAMNDRIRVIKSI